MTGKPIQLKGLSALRHASSGTVALLPFCSFWFWYCIACWIVFVAATSGFNACLSRTSMPMSPFTLLGPRASAYAKIPLLASKQTLSRDVLISEIDLTSTGVALMYADNSAFINSSTGNNWEAIRGLYLSESLDNPITHNQLTLTVRSFRHPPSLLKGPSPANDAYLTTQDAGRASAESIMFNKTSCKLFPANVE